MHRSESKAQLAAHKKAGAFLKTLIMDLDSEGRDQFCEKLVKAEREEKCIRNAMFLMVVLLMTSIVGLGYCALLLPDVFRNPSHLLMRGLYVLGLTSIISQAVFLGHLLWHRTAVTRLHEECRLLVLALVRSRRTGQATSNGDGSVATHPQGHLPSSSPANSAKVSPSLDTSRSDMYSDRPSIHLTKHNHENTLQ